MTTSALDSRPTGGLSRLTPLAVIALLIFGVIYAGWSLFNDLGDVHSPSLLPFILLGIALLIALGFEFVNGFHDTANAVATVIYTNSLPPTVAVVWSGFFNFLGVLTSTGAVAFGIISLLPVELILQVGSNAGFAMVFALLIAAIIWNVGTWYFGLPSSSSHTLIGSIIGVGLMNQLMAIPGTGTSGVDWSQALGIGKSLLLSPLIGFAAAALLLLAAKALIKRPELYRAPEGNKPPPLWIRGLLVLTCTGVSFAHGSNDGQKGMGLIMLILIGTVPTAYALNRAMPEAQITAFEQVSQQAAGVLARYAGDVAAPADARAAVTAYVRDRALAPETVPALVALTHEIDRSVAGRSSLASVPAEQTGNIRNDMYLTSEALKQMAKTNTPAFSAEDGKVLTHVSRLSRPGDQVHPGLGQGGGRHRARPRHHGRLEAHRRHRRREDRQGAPDLRPGRLGRAGGDGDDRRRRHVRPAGQHHPCAVLRRRRHHGGEPLRPAMEHDPQPADGLGADPAGLDRPGGRALLAAAAPVLIRGFARGAGGAGQLPFRRRRRRRLPLRPRVRRLPPDRGRSACRRRARAGSGCI